MKERNITYSVVIEILIQLACTIYIFHRNNFFHCDGHGNNVMLKKNHGKPIVFDCGTIGKFQLNPEYLVFFIDLDRCKTSKEDRHKSKICIDDMEIILEFNYFLFDIILKERVDPKSIKQINKLKTKIDEIYQDVLVQKKDKKRWRKRKYDYYVRVLIKLLFSEMISDHVTIIKRPKTND
jgi:hypothetical protein